MRVRVFRNLHKKCMSVIAMEGPFKGKMTAHVESASLSNCKMVVSEAPRQRLLIARQKNVHAWVEGELQSARLLNLRYAQPNFPLGAEPDGYSTRIKYDPYKCGHFYDVDTEIPAWSAASVTVKTTGVWAQ